MPLSGVSAYAIENPDGGFVDFPAGTVTVDPASMLVADSNHLYHMKNRPALRGQNYAPSYDLAMRQWLPVPFDSISPDGSQYAWIDYSKFFSGQAGPNIQPVHITDVASGNDRVVNSDRDWDHPVWDSANTIYLVRHGAQSDVSIGLWRLNVSTGAATVVDADGLNWGHPGLGAAWGGNINLSDPHPPSGKNPTNTVVRLDLATGARTDWFYRPGMLVNVIGTTRDGLPLVTVGSSQYQPETGDELWLLSAPGRGQRVATSAQGPLAFSGAWADGSVTWVQAVAVSPASQWGIYRLDGSGLFSRLTLTGVSPVPTGGCH